MHWLSDLPTQCKQDILWSNVRVWCAIFPGLAHKRLIRALQKYLHCKQLPLNTSQGLINALFKSCAPITNWLESSASSITQKRPLQVKIHMIYTWKAFKGINSLLISHKCLNSQVLLLILKKKECVHSCVRVCSLKCALQTDKHTIALGIYFNEAET